MLDPPEKTSPQNLLSSELIPNKSIELSEKNSTRMPLMKSPQKIGKKTSIYLKTANKNNEKKNININIANQEDNQQQYSGRKNMNIQQHKQQNKKKNLRIELENFNKKPQLSQQQSPKNQPQQPQKIQNQKLTLQHHHHQQQLQFQRKLTMAHPKNFKINRALPFNYMDLTNAQKIIAQQMHFQKTKTSKKDNQHINNIHKYFNFTLPDNINLDQNTIYGECKIQTNFHLYRYWQSQEDVKKNIQKRNKYITKMMIEQSDDYDNNNNRHQTKYLATSTLLLLLRPLHPILKNLPFYQYFTHSQKHFIKIQYQNIQQFKLSQFYSDILICYRDKNKQMDNIMKFHKIEQLNQKYQGTFDQNDQLIDKINQYKEYSVVVQCSDQQKLRKYLCKYVNNIKKMVEKNCKNGKKQPIIYQQDDGSNSQRNAQHPKQPLLPIYEYNQCTLFGHLQRIHNLYGLPNLYQQNPDPQSNPKYQDKLLNPQDINHTKIINLRKCRQQLNKYQLTTEGNLSNRKKERKLKDIYEVIDRFKKKQGSNQENKNKNKTNTEKYDQIDKYCNIFIARNLGSNLSANNLKAFSSKNKESANSSSIKYQNIYTIKAFSIQTITSNQFLLHQLSTETKLYSEQQLLTPYFPTLLLTAFISDTYILQYKYYEGHTLRTLVTKGRINKWKMSVIKFILAEIAVAIGHVHECGFLFGRVSLDNVMINYDGHILLINTSQFRKMGKYYRNKKQSPSTPTNNQNQTQLIQQINKKISNLQKLIPKSPYTLTPQSLTQGQHSLDYISDWFHFGLLIYQLLSGGTHYYDNYTFSQKKLLSFLTNQQLQFQLHDNHQLHQLIQKQQSLQPLLKNLLNKNPKQRLGYLNDYHQILDTTFFKTIDKKKLMKRQGQSGIKIQKRKINKQKNSFIGILEGKIINHQDQLSLENNQENFSKQQIQMLLRELVFDQTLDFN